MSSNEFFSDYDVSLTVEDDYGDDEICDYDEDQIKQLLFDNNDDDDDLKHEKKKKTFTSKQNGEGGSSSGDGQRDSFNISKDTRNKSTTVITPVATTVNESNLITLTSSEDVENDGDAGDDVAGCEKKSYRTYDVPDDDDEDDDNERHTRFKSERTIKTVSSKHKRDIPDSLDCVIISDDASSSRKGVKRKNDDYHLRQHQQQQQHQSLNIRPKIHINPHFRGLNKPSLLGAPKSQPPFLVNDITAAPQQKMFRPSQSFTTHPSAHSSHQMLTLPLNDLHPNFIESMNSFPTKKFSSPQKLSDVQANFSEHGFWSSPPNEVHWDNTAHYPPVQRHPLFHSNGSGNNNNNLRVNHSNYDIYTNNLPFTQSSPLQQHEHRTQIPLTRPTGLINSQTQPRHSQTFTPQADLHKEQMNRFLPRNVLMARFPLQYQQQQQRPEFPQYPRPAELPCFTPIPTVERFQTPMYRGINRALLPRPPFPPQIQTNVTNNLEHTSSIRPLLQPKAHENKAFNIQAKKFNSDFGTLTSLNKHAHQYSQPNHCQQQHSQNTISPLLAKNRPFLNKYTGIKTIINRNENDSRKIALYKTKQAKKFLQKRPLNSSLKHVTFQNQNNTLTKVTQANTVTMNSSTKQAAEASTKKQATVAAVSSTKSPVKVNTETKSTDGNDERNKNIEIIEIDDEYRQKLEEQKRKRESILRMKEMRRKETAQMKLKLLNSNQTEKTNTEQIKTLIDTNRLNSQQQQQNQVPRVRNVIDLTQIKSTTTITAVNKKVPANKCTVNIKGLALTTTEASISKLCATIGPTKSITLNASNNERIATVVFEHPKDAFRFQNRYQHYLLDLCVIQLTIS